MKTRFLVFASRNRKELLRDLLTLAFGIGMPIILLCLLSAMQKNIPVPLFNIESLAPGIAVFSFSFVSLFAGLLLAKDKSSSFLTRLFASPLTATDYILGYTLPLIVISLLQSVICFTFAVLLGLQISINILLAMLALIPVALLYIGFGLLFGTLFNDKQVGGIFSIFVNVTTWLSGTWFSLDLVGGAFKTIGNLLPFVHAVDLVKGVLNADYSAFVPNLVWVLAYAIAIFTVSIIIFKKKMRG